MSADDNLMLGRARKSVELRVFLILAVVLAPFLAVAIVGGLGLAIWVYQMFAGPPGAPGH